MEKKRSTPQEKKVRSYQKDRRNAYGENDKSSRKAIRKRKAQGNRVLRRQETQVLGRADEDPEAAAEAIGAVKRRSWRKVPDRPLAEHIDEGFDYGREGLGERREDKKGLRAEARKRLRQSGSGQS